MNESGEDMARFTLYDDVSIGDGQPTFIVAEIGANHNGDPNLARRCVEAAAECGVDAVKFQTYTAYELLSHYNSPVTWGPEGHTVTEEVGGMFDRLALPRTAHRPLFDYAESLGLMAFSTPFSVDGLDFLLDELDMPCIKIASSDVCYPDLLLRAARSDRPVMLSVGKSSLAEADMAVSTLLENGCDRLVLMHCVANYPSRMEDMNLRTIESLKMMYPECVIGFSDHSMGITASLGAVALGARVIEKHFTLSNETVGPDHWFSMDPESMAALVREVRNLEAALGRPRKHVLPSEVQERHGSVRSLSVARDMKCGERIRLEDLRVVRPGWGINPWDREKILGLALACDLPAESVLEWRHFKEQG
ncbi:MAG: N-acetylneuraminate synthase [Fretibacterium sp.]|nr:N-acetylneuraminate synthase [Fretibacterium sp.]